MRDPIRISGPSEGRFQVPTDSIQGAAFQPETKTNPSRVLAMLGQGLGIYASQKAREEALAEQRRQQIQANYEASKKAYQQRNTQLVKQRGQEYRLQLLQAKADAQTLTGVEKYKAQRRLAVLANAGSTNPQLAMQDRQWAAQQLAGLNKDNTQFTTAIEAQKKANYQAFIANYTTNSITVASGLIDDKRIIQLGSAQSIDDTMVRQALLSSSIAWLQAKVSSEQLTNKQLTEILRSPQFIYGLDKQAAKQAQSIRKRAIQLELQAVQRMRQKGVETVLSSSRTPENKVELLVQAQYPREQAQDMVRDSTIRQLSRQAPTVIGFDRLRGAQMNPLLDLNQTQFGSMLGTHVDRYFANLSRNYSIGQIGSNKLRTDLQALAQLYGVQMVVQDDKLRFVSATKFLNQNGQIEYKDSLDPFSRQLAKKLQQMVDNSGMDIQMQLSESSPVDLSTVTHANHDQQHRSFISLMDLTSNTDFDTAMKAWRTNLAQLQQVGVLGGISEATTQLFDQAAKRVIAARNTNNPEEKHALLKEAFILGGVADGHRSNMLTAISPAAVTRLRQSINSGTQYDIHWAMNFMANNSKAKDAIFQLEGQQGFLARMIFQDYHQNELQGGPDAILNVRQRYVQLYDAYQTAYDNMDERDYEKVNLIQSRILNGFLQGQTLHPSARYQVAIGAVAEARVTGQQPLSAQSLRNSRKALIADGWKFYRMPSGQIGLTRSANAISVEEQKQIFENIKKSLNATKKPQGSGARRAFTNILPTLPNSGPKADTDARIDNALYLQGVLKVALARAENTLDPGQTIYGSQSSQFKNLMSVLAGKWSKNSNVRFSQTSTQHAQGGATIVFDFVQLNGVREEVQFYLTSDQLAELQRVGSTAYLSEQQERIQRRNNPDLALDILTAGRSN